ncbi:MAG: MarR family transcriptional regulator [Hydrogenophaga sp.]
MTASKPSLARRQDSLGWQVAVLSEEMAAALDERLRPRGLTIAEWPTLFSLWERDGITQTELSRACRTRNYTTSRVIDRLEEAGWVARKEDPASRRNWRVELTAGGRKRMTQLLAEADAVNRQFLARLTPAQGRTLQHLLAVMVSS